MIRYDRSTWSVVVTCTCGWRELTLTQEGAWSSARRHETDRHPDRFQVRHAELQRSRDRDRPAGPSSTSHPESDGSGGTLDQ